MVSDLERFCLRAAGLGGLMAVSFGAFGAHALKRLTAALPPEAAARALGWVDTGAKYQLVHAAALLGLAALAPRWDRPAARRAARLLFFGPLIFSGTLYAMALGGPLWLGAVTPVGGAAMLAGWAAVLAAGFRREEA